MEEQKMEVPKGTLRIENLSLSFRIFDRCYRALHAVDLELRAGESLGIVGESGSGKTTLGKAILGLNPPERSVVEGGSIFYNGEDLLKIGEKRLRAYRGKEIAMIFQDPLSALNPTMSAGKQVLESFFTKNPALSYREGRERVIELFNWLGIPDPKERFDHYPHQLSGGLRQRVLIAIALAFEPKILIADEPTTALDAILQMQILRLFEKIQVNLGMSLIFITHNLALLPQIVSKIAVMYAGRVIESAPIDRLLRFPSHPYTQRLLQSIPRGQLSKKDRLHPIEGSSPSILEPIAGCPFHPRCNQRLACCSQKMPPWTELGSDQATSCWLHVSDTKI